MTECPRCGVEYQPVDELRLQLVHNGIHREPAATDEAFGPEEDYEAREP